MIEVEVKVSVENTETVENLLLQKGLHKGKFVKECDFYFDNLKNDIRNGDQALRIRSCEDFSTGKIIAFMTHKGPKMDQISMTRPEVELEITDANVGIQLITSLGYTKQYPVIKCRQYFHKEQMTVCLDQVDKLGDFLEVEMIVEKEEEKANALNEILEFLQELGYSKEHLLRKSYLSMLQDKSSLT